MNRENQRIFTSSNSHVNANLSQSQLKWSSQIHNLTVSGKQDFNALNRLKNVILSLRKDWGSQSSGGIKLEGREDYQKRLQLAEKQIEGILKRKINCSVKDSQGGERVLDYTSILNQKENQIVELEKKIQNLEQKLRKSSLREAELQNHVVILSEELKRKDDLIALKHNSAIAEVNNCSQLKEALNKIKKNIEVNRYKLGEAERIIMEGVVIPEVGNFDIKADALNQNTLSSKSRVHQQLPQNAKNKVKIVQLFRQFERLVSQQDGFTDFEVERILEGFLNNMAETKLYQKMRRSLDIFALTFEHQRLRQNFAVAATIFADVVAKLKQSNARLALPAEIDNLFELLRREKVVAFQVPVGNIFVEMNPNSHKVVEVPVQDAKTKHLIHLLAREFRKIYFKYPKLQGQIDSNLAQFLQQEIIDIIEVDQIQKLVSIVKIQSEVVKVDNVYMQSSEKERRKEFHLRVLVKALLEELEKIRAKTGVVLELDEGVVGMIKAEIMDTVDVDDILKVFRINQKIVEVEKVVQKIVQRVIEVPKVVTVEKLVEKIVEVEKVKQVEKIVHVPIDKPLIVETEVQKLVPYEKKVETIIQVPTIVEKIVELQKEIPRIQEVQLTKQKIVEVEVPVEIQKVVNHIQTEVQEIEVLTQKIVPVQKIIEKIVEVPVFVETIVQKMVQIPKVVEVERIVEKIVPVVEYRNAKEVQNHVEVRYEVVDRIVQKVVPVIQIKERIKQVPKQVQVLKQVTNVVTEIKEVEVLREKLVIQEVIKEVQRVETKVVQVVREVPYQIQKFIEVPIIKEVPVIKQIVVQKPVVSTVESVHVKQVSVKVPFIVKEPVVVEVEKFVNVFVEVPKTIKYVEEKLVEVPTIIDRIKQIPVQIDKIIEKMVEVPRVVEVEKIVEKVVVVPRVIQKVVEVPQFIQKLIEKEVIREKVVEVQKIVHVPVIKQVVKEVQKINNIYIEIEKPVDRIVERSVEVPRYEEKILTKEVVRQVPITIIEERPVQLEVEKVVPMAYECVHTVQVEKQIIVPFEIPVPVQTIVEKVIPKQDIIERIIPTPQIMEKIVPVVEYVTEVKEIDKYVEKILIERQIKEVEKIVPYIQEVIKEVPTIIEKIVTVEKNIDNIVTVEKVIEKVIEKTMTLPQIYQVERIKQKLVEVPKLIEIEKVVPQIIKVNQYIHKIAEKLVEVPTLIETIKEVVRDQEKIVPFKEETTQIVQVQKYVEKLVYAQKLKEVVRNVNYIEKVLQIVDRIEQVPVAVPISEQKFIEVPYIIEKIVEKIVVMPQIVQVLKYIHEVCEAEDAGVAVDVDVGTHEAKYKQLSRNVEKHLDSVLRQLRMMKIDQAAKTKIQTIEKFLEELRKFILTPRIVKVVQEKIVESKVPVEKIVKVPTQDEDSLRMELSLSILTQKLIGELRRVKQKTGVNLQLDEDIRLIFFNELDTTVPLEGDSLQKLQNYSNHVNRQFQSLGSWTSDQQIMLKSFLQDRFLMAEMIQNADLEMESIKLFADQQTGQINKSNKDLAAMTNFLKRISKIIDQNRPVNEIVAVIDEFGRYDSSSVQEPTIALGDLVIDNKFSSILREKDAQISSLRDTIFSLQKPRGSQSPQEHDITVKVLKSQIDNLRQQNTMLFSKTSETGLLQSQKSQINQIKERNFQLESEISRLKSENYNLKSERSFVEQVKGHVFFRRDPESSVQEVEARQSGFDRSLYSDVSQGYGQSIQPHQTESVIFKPGTAGFDSTGRKMESSHHLDTRLEQSGTGSSSYKSPPEQAYQPGQLGSSLTYSQGSNLFSSQKRQVEHQTSRFTPTHQHQSAIKTQTISFEPGQLRQGPSFTQSGIGSFGVEDSHALRMGQERNTGTTSQFDSRIGTTQGLISSKTEQNSGSYGISKAQPTFQAQYAPQRAGGSSLGGSSIGGNIQQLFASRGGEQSRTMPPTYPTTQTMSQSQSGVTYTAGQTGAYLQGSQTGQGGLVPRTPIEGYKYTSPSPSGVKLTQSIIRQEESSLSKVSAESPQVPQVGKAETSRGQYQYYTRPERKQEQRKE